MISDRCLFGARGALGGRMREVSAVCFPRVCVACGAPDPEASPHLCWECQREVPLLRRPFCERCGDPIAGRSDHAYECALCARREPTFESARSAARYEGPCARAVRALKYHGATWVADDLAGWMESVVRAEWPGAEFDFLTPVPLHARRRREREYNQAELLARALGRRLGRPVRPGALRRVRATPSQTRLTVKERADNMKNAFEAGRLRALAGARVLLVDDVMTTGATLHDAARALRQGGAAEVRAVTVARG